MASGLLTTPAALTQRRCLQVHRLGHQLALQLHHPLRELLHKVGVLASTVLQARVSLRMAHASEATCAGLQLVSWSDAHTGHAGSTLRLFQHDKVRCRPSHGRGAGSRGQAGGGRPAGAAGHAHHHAAAQRGQGVLCVMCRAFLPAAGASLDALAQAAA